ncbi:MAG: PEGA domain-containing protein [Sedimentisphaerales bacterium]|nr:PEGA domain-containing protein [Sedimentisphaerales bacterium]
MKCSESVNVDMRIKTRKIRDISAVMLGVWALLCLGGCVERLITVNSEPAGALVWLNGEEAGLTPMTVRFQEYGEYEVILRKAGYDTIRTTRMAETPIYQWPGLDLISECLLPGTLVDEHLWEFELSASVETEVEPLIERAGQLRNEAVSQDLVQ